MYLLATEHTSVFDLVFVLWCLNSFIYNGSGGKFGIMVTWWPFYLDRYISFTSWHLFIDII